MSDDVQAAVCVEHVCQWCGSGALDGPEDRSAGPLISVRTKRPMRRSTFAVNEAMTMRC